MRKFLPLIAALGCVGLAACQSQPPKPAALASRLAAQNSILEAEYQFDLKMHPERATEYGDYRYNDRLNDYSLTAVETIHSTEVDFFARLKAISTDGFAEQDQLSHEVMLRILQQHLDDYRFKEYELSVNQMRGPHVELADLPLSVPLDSLQRYQDYIARLHQIPRALVQTKEVLRAGMRDHLMPVGFLLQKIPAQCQGVIAANPFLLPTQRYPDSISAQDRERLTQEITETVTREVLPAYQDFGQFIATEYAPHGRSTLSVTSLPGGAERYLNDIRGQTTVSDLTPAQIHELGLHEIVRIESEIRSIAQSQGFSDLASFRAALKADPRYTPGSAQQIVADFERYVAQMRPKLPQLFGVIPDAPLTV
jgi:uncharacterized protein (DUF885 family)